MVMYLRLPLIHTYTIRDIGYPPWSPLRTLVQLFTSVKVLATIRYVSRSMYYIRNSFGLVKSLFKVTLNQKSEV